MPSAHVPGLADLARTLASAAPEGFDDLFLERVREVWWSRDGSSRVSRQSLHREGAAARSGELLRSTDGVDRIALASLLEVPARSLPPLHLPEPPPEPELGAWPHDEVVVVRWRWNWACVVRADMVTEIGRPLLAELTLADGGRELSVWPASASPPVELSPDREVRRLPQGGPILLAPAAAAALVHEVVGHRLEADLSGAAGAGACRTLGESLFAIPVDVVDDPTLDLPGGFTADDEGVAAQPRQLLIGGLVAGLLADRRAATRLGVSPGNARRGGMHAPPRPRISNLLTSGRGRSLSSLRSAARVEVEAVEAAMLDASSGIVWLAVRSAQLLHRGRRKGRLPPFTLRGTLAALHGGLLAVSRDTAATARPGWCRKHGEVVPTGAVTPWMLVEGMEIL